MARPRGSDTQLCKQVTSLLAIMRLYTEPDHVQRALNELRVKQDTRNSTRRFYDALHVLQALKVVPVVGICHKSKENRDCRLLNSSEVVYRHLHSNPGPYIPKSLSAELNVKERRVYDTLVVLQAIGLVSRDVRCYVPTPRLDDSAAYWWSNLCKHWGEVDRTTLVCQRNSVTRKVGARRSQAAKVRVRRTGSKRVGVIKTRLRRNVGRAARAITTAVPHQHTRSDDALHVAAAAPVSISEPMLDSANEHTDNESVYTEWDSLTGWISSELESYFEDQFEFILEVEPLAAAAQC